MRDIYHELVASHAHLKQSATEDLKEYSDHCADGAFAITSALTLIGNLAIDAVDSEDMDGSEALQNLKMVGYALKHLPRIAQALEQNSESAQWVLRCRSDQERLV